MKYSKVFGKTTERSPKEAETISHKLLIKGGFIDKALVSGVYTFLPLGWRVHQKIERIIREEMNAIGGQEMFMPTLQPKSLWAETNRWETIDPPLFKLKDRHSKDLALGSTHEEVLTDIVRRQVFSYKDLPLYLYHIQNKFRNEMRSSGGLLRVREFVMKDLYSFHAGQKDLDDYYEKVKKAYIKIFTRCGLRVKVIEASGGSIGGEVTHEFNMLCPTGEDKLVYCKNCDFAANREVFKGKVCKKCGEKLIEARGIENGHIFKLGTQYSKKMGAYFTDRDGKKKLIWMGCYGIGLGRLLATVVEANHDEKGIIWPKSVAPFDCHLINLKTQISNVKAKCQNSKLTADGVYKKLVCAGTEVLCDDREDVSIGEKFADADLIGIPVRLVVSPKTKGKIEWKERGKEKREILGVEEVIKRVISK